MKHLITAILTFITLTAANPTDWWYYPGSPHEGDALDLSEQSGLLIYSGGGLTPLCSIDVWISHTGEMDSADFREYKNRDTRHSMGPWHVLIRRGSGSQYHIDSWTSLEYLSEEMQTSTGIPFENNDTMWIGFRYDNNALDPSIKWETIYFIAYVPGTGIDMERPAPISVTNRKKILPTYYSIHGRRLPGHSKPVKSGVYFVKTAIGFKRIAIIR